MKNSQRAVRVSRTVAFVLLTALIVLSVPTAVFAAFPAKPLSAPSPTSQLPQPSIVARIVAGSGAGRIRVAAYQAIVPIRETAPATVRPVKLPAAATAAGYRNNELFEARRILAGQIAKYPILKGTTVEIGPTPNNYQAVAYYTIGRIVINPNHVASLQRIIEHECAHIIDWRQDGDIDNNDSR